MLSRRILFPTALCMALVASPPSSAHAADLEPTPEARAHFKLGLELLKSEQNEAALRELKAAYAITPKWTALISIGIASERLERDGEAIDAYERYLDEGGAGTPKAESVRRSVEELRARAATVTLEAPGQFWIIDTRDDAEGPVVNEYGPFENRAELRVREGQHEFKLDRSSSEAPAWRVLLRARNEAAHVFARESSAAVVEAFEAAPLPAAPEPEPDVPPPSHPASYVLWGTGAVGAVATSVFLLEANSIQSEANEDFAERCPVGAGIAGCELTPDGSKRAARWRTAGLVTGIGTLGALATGTVLYFLNSSSSRVSEHADEASVQPWISPTGIGVSGTF